MKFKIPIEYIERKQPITDEIKSDFHLNESNTIFELVLTQKDKDYTTYRLDIIDKIKSQYSYDASFLKQTQTFIDTFKNEEYSQNECIQTWNTLNTFDSHSLFCRNYNFIEYSHFKHLNNQPLFMQAYSTYQLGSPILQFLVPFILLIIPFFLIMCLSKGTITFSNYFNILKNVMKKHSLGNIFNVLSNEVDISTKVTSVLFLAFYFVSIYQNYMSCIKHYSNVKEMKHILCALHSHIVDTKINMDCILNTINVYSLSKYDAFAKDMYEIREDLDKYHTLIETNIHYNDNTIHWNDLLRVGNMTSLFYRLKNDTVFNDVIQYSFYCNEFYNCIVCFNTSIQDYDLHKNIPDTTRGYSILNQVNPLLRIHDVSNIVSHTVSLESNSILTGGNATGKTTFLKTTFLNILMSQIFGYGFYEEANIPIYNKLFSYINIPDTNERDSLFQNEARRCLNIIQYVKEEYETNKEKHRIFCVFDELFTGTNIDDATYAGMQCIKYLNTYNVDFILTTHFTNMIQKLKKEGVENEELRFFRTTEEYTLKQGISKVRVGKQILKELGYPSDFFN